ncbi:E3 ubiquitin-protein ligase RNF34 isoform X1 [Oenanthe melanoleuca]|uniref:E3 ubiquitin-protein ligase RNF34 isoform X1 n=2 Tax=Oenanthe melanoleuca TaxID=2939378 RepID=UPI0024C1E89E|nr:E3 ubiquitin-protein ligase RNF34 isoform X1 [Oenanthe melanoleuca]
MGATIGAPWVTPPLTPPVPLSVPTALGHFRAPSAPPCPLFPLAAPSRRRSAAANGRAARRLGSQWRAARRQGPPSERRPGGVGAGRGRRGAGAAGAAMKAGATSMWASCCGLLNEVMGTGAVRGQQAAFGGGAGPFRFTPSTGFSAYPAPAAAGTNIVCKACGLSFSVFRKKHVCCDCKKDFCSVCSVLQENLRRCSTCHLLQETAFQRPQLMRLKVKDLRQYLILRNIPTDTCREKEDLVDLVLCHHGLGSQEDMDAGSLRSSRSQSSGFFTHPFSTSVSMANPGELASRRGSTGSGTPSRGQTETSVNNEEEESAEEQTPGLARKRARASLSDISSLEDIEGLSVRQLKEILACNFVNYSGCCEKWELVEKVSRLYRENEENHKTQGERMQLNEDDDSLCRICMDAVIDCVLLECGHMVTCTKCGKRMSECPICRQYVVRAVHVFKS